MEIILLVAGLILGILIGWLLFRNANKSEISVSEQKIKMLEESNQELKNELETKSKELLNTSNNLSSRDTELLILKKRLEEQKEELLKIQEKLNLEFKNLANEILEEKTKKFTEQNKTNLDEILKPLNDKIKDFEKKVEDAYVNETKQRFSLQEEVKRLAELNQQISKEANSLTKALKGESKTQGNWGEMILESILERTGLRKGEEYTVQESLTMDDGKRFQPDVIVHYPGDRSIVIDSKVSLTAYERYISADNEVSRASELKEHINSVRNHINGLSGKNYEDLNGIKTLDFVMMFLPVEPAYLLAIQNDSQLWSYAYERRILLISPTNLVAVLKMIESLWKQEYQSRNVLEIARQGGALYDDFVLLSERLIKLGKKIEETSDLYKDTMKKITEGKGNLVSRVEKLKDLGIKAKKQIPQNLVDRAIEFENQD
ncbi:MAG: DNA recombination protein RmuC [Bacteroidales bacterium]|nr:DNA recombination protein RmuC [Bacteroidales bacterium]MBN2819229.1 DNA recombination protein RmuC [Bacteroidales bacterium]